MSRSVWLLLGAVFALAACSSVKESNPPRTATEQLMLSTAADRAADRVAERVAADVKGSKIFVDAANFEGLDGKYAIAAIRDRLLRLGGNLAKDRDSADMVVEIRAGALSMDDQQTLVGIPRFDIPVPLAGPVSFPEIALFKKRQRTGIAKFGATGYGAQDGHYVASTDAQYGLSRETQWVVLLFISWSTNDYMPEEIEEGTDSGLSVNVLRKDSGTAAP
jgi:hypothetical protein